MSSPAVFNPVTAGITAGFDLLGLGMHLLASHDQRIQIATEENHAVQQAVVTLDSDLKTIFAAANAGDITAITAAQACYDVHLWYWQFITPVQQGPTKGAQQTFPNPSALSSKSTANIYYTALDGPNCHCSGSSCTAGCCIGCSAIDPTLSNIYVLFSQGKAFTVQTAAVVGNKYGLLSRPSYYLSYKPPAKIVPEEVTINTKSGVVSVGAPPSTSDAIIATGLVGSTAAPDEGGVATGALVAPPGSVGSATSQIVGISNTALLGVGAAFLFAIILLAGGKRDAA